MEWMLMPLRRYAEFSGRSRRMEFWMFALLSFIVYMVGYALLLAGGGLSLALAADIRLAAPTASFTAAFTRIGLSLGDLGASWLLPRIIGPAAAAELAYTGGTLDAAEAFRLRLVNRVVEEGGVVDAALELTASIARNSPAGVRLSKRALQANLEISSYAAALELENRGQTLLTRTNDMGEALQAFLEKRPARFGNR